MGLLGMALRNLRQRWLASVLTGVSIALGVALVVAVMLLEREARQAFTGTAHGVEILVGGNKGGRIETLLSALYHVGRAPGRVAWAYYEQLEAHPDVDYAIPLAYGDTYRGLPVVGTTEEMLGRFRPRPNLSFEIHGESLGRRRAVVGAEAARRTGLKVGDTFFPAHGRAAGDLRHRDERFTVAGTVRATGTAHDRVIWIAIEDFLDLRGHSGLAREAEERAVSAVLVKTASKSPLIVEGLIREINDGTEAQAIRPMQVVGELWTLIGDVQRLLSWAAVVVIAVAAVSVMVSLYNTMADRRREIAILRALGAGRSQVFLSILLEAALLCGLGALLGLLLGHGGAAVAAPIVEARAGVRLESPGLLPEEPLLLAALFAVGCLAGIVPALTAYRIDVAKGLEPVA
ncbi:MAG: ABC transporter permease [Planctomycetota bacterium]|jgi:putative ABC transport system permease protein